MPIRNYFGFIFSIFVSGAMLWSCSFEIEQMVVGELLTIPGGKYKFLTILNLYLQIFYYILCIINFIFGTNTIELEKRSLLQKFRDFIFAGAAFPLGTFVSVVFWGLYHVDRKLIFPEEAEKFLPPILNHIMHTFPGIMIWIENLFHYHRYPSRISGLLCILSITIAYIIWIHYLHYIHLISSKISFWIYPILNELSFIYRGLFFFGSTLFVIGLYFMGEMYTYFLTNVKTHTYTRRLMMNLILSLIFLLLILPEIFSLFSSKTILCNQSISNPSLDLSLTTNQNVSLILCNITFHLTIHPNEYFFSRNISIDKSIKIQAKRRFAYLGHIINEEHSSISLIIYPQLEIFIYLNGTYYYYLSLLNNSTIILKFSQKQLLQYYPQLVNDNLWKILQEEEDIYQKNSLILHDLHFIYEFLTLRCEIDNEQYKTISFCSLALFIDQLLYKDIFYSNIYYLYIFIEHFNFLLRTLTRYEYGGFLLKRLTLINHIETNFNSTFDYLHILSNNISLGLKDYCLVHQMLLTNEENDNYILGYQSSIHTYDIGGICSLPFSMNNNNSDEINLNTGLSILNENLTKNLSSFFNGLMKTSYLFFRQMGLNLTLCSINATRKSFFQFNTDLSPVIQHCIDLIPITLRPALKRRAHLCFNHLNIYNTSNQSIKQQITCKQSIDLQSSVPIGGKHRKSPYIENALNNNRRGEWFEGNIVGIILTCSLLIWIPVSCFVHFFVDEINKKAFIEKQQQQQEMEILSTKPTINEQISLTKQTQTE